MNAFAQKSTQDSGENLLGDSKMCKEYLKNYPELEKCTLRSGPVENLKNFTSQLIHNQGTRLSEMLKNDLFEKVQSSLVSQYAAATWLGVADPKKGKNSQTLKNALQQSESSCNPNVKKFPDLSKKLNSMDAIKELGLNGIPSAQLETSKEFIQKRMMIAWIEISRIERFMHDRPHTKEEKKKLKSRLEKIKQTYPLVATSPNAFTLNQLTNIEYGSVLQMESPKSHPEIDKILFPENNHIYAAINLGQTQQGNEGLINSIVCSVGPRRLRRGI